MHEITRGKMLGIDGEFNINYGRGMLAHFSDQIVTEPMSALGDSGSVGFIDTLDTLLTAVGLLFAGSPSLTIYNKISNVFNILRLKLP